MENVNPYNTPRGDLVSGAGGYGPTTVFSFEPRAGRLRYLARSGIMTLLMYLVIGVVVGLAALTGNETAIAAATGIGMVIVVVASLVLGFMFAAQRLHDLNQSGWLSLLMLVPFVNFIFALYLLFAPGTDGSNNYGQPPPPNTGGIILAAFIFPLIFTVGIIAAIAIPAYQGYMQQAQEMQIEE